MEHFSECKVLDGLVQMHGLEAQRRIPLWYINEETRKDFVVLGRTLFVGQNYNATGGSDFDAIIIQDHTTVRPIIAEHHGQTDLTDYKFGRVFIFIGLHHERGPRIGEIFVGTRLKGASAKHVTENFTATGIQPTGEPLTPLETPDWLMGEPALLHTLTNLCGRVLTLSHTLYLPNLQVHARALTLTRCDGGVSNIVLFREHATLSLTRGDIVVILFAEMSWLSSPYIIPHHCDMVTVCKAMDIGGRATSDTTQMLSSAMQQLTLV